MKITFFNYFYNVKGSARGAVEQNKAMARGLENLGHEVGQHFRSARDYQRHPDDADAAGSSFVTWLKKFKFIRRYAHMIKVFLRNIPYYFQEKKILREEKPDLVVVMLAYGNYSGRWAARSLGIPLVVISDYPNYYEYSTFFPQYHPYKWLGKKIEKNNLRKSDAIICISAIIKGYLCNYGISSQKMTVIPNGVDHTRFKPVAKDNALLHKYGLEDTCVVGFIGSFNFFDDIKEISGVFIRLASEHKHLKYLFIGQGDQGDELQKILHSSDYGDRFVFTGVLEHSEIPSHLNLMDIVLSPYKGDYLFYGSSMKMLEYMAAGKASVVTSLGQIRELVHDRCNGMFFEWQDYQGFYEAISFLIENPDERLKIGQNARKTIENGWTWEIQSRKMSAVLNDTLAKHRDSD